MNSRSLAPFWAVDVVGLLVVGVLCALGKVGADTAVAIVVAVLGLGAVSRVRARQGVVETNEAPEEPPTLPPTSTRPASRRSRNVPLGGLVGLVYAIGHVLKHTHS